VSPKPKTVIVPICVHGVPKCVPCVFCERDTAVSRP